MHSSLCRSYRLGIRRISLLRYGIITATSPWMTAQDAPYRKVQSFERTMLPECLKGILRACGSKAAAGWLERRYTDLIEPYQENEWGCRNLSDDACSIIQPRFHLFSVLQRQTD